MKKFLRDRVAAGAISKTKSAIALYGGDKADAIDLRFVRRSKKR